MQFLKPILKSQNNHIFKFHLYYNIYYRDSDTGLDINLVFYPTGGFKTISDLKDGLHNFIDLSNHKIQPYINELTLSGSQPEYTFTKVDLRYGYLVKIAVYPAIKVAAISIRFLCHIMYENKKMCKNESLQKQNKTNKSSVIGRTIRGFCNGDICTVKREMEIRESLTQPK